MDIKLTDDQALKSVISEALLRAVDENTRETLIKAAIEKLLTPEDVGYGHNAKKRSAVQRAFDYAVEEYARNYATQLLNSDETLQSKIKAVLADAAEFAFVENKEATVKRVAAAISEGLWKSDR